jgi:hypothetical protein
VLVVAAKYLLRRIRCAIKTSQRLVLVVDSADDCTALLSLCIYTSLRPQARFIGVIKTIDWIEVSLADTMSPSEQRTANPETLR